MCIHFWCYLTWNGCLRLQYNLEDMFTMAWFKIEAMLKCAILVSRTEKTNSALNYKPQKKRHEVSYFSCMGTFWVRQLICRSLNSGTKSGTGFRTSLRVFQRFLISSYLVTFTAFSLGLAALCPLLLSFFLLPSPIINPLNTFLHQREALKELVFE